MIGYSARHRKLTERGVALMSVVPAAVLLLHVGCDLYP